jgi:hypothetical protein
LRRPARTHRNGTPWQTKINLRYAIFDPRTTGRSPAELRKSNTFSEP